MHPDNRFIEDESQERSVLNDFVPQVESIVSFLESIRIEKDTRVKLIGLLFGAGIYYAAAGIKSAAKEEKERRADDCRTMIDMALTEIHQCIEDADIRLQVLHLISELYSFDVSDELAKHMSAPYKTH